MDINNKEEGNTQAAHSTVIQSEELKKQKLVNNEDVSGFKRRGRMGAAQATQGLTKRNSKGHSTNQSEVYRVVISSESNLELESVLYRCMDGFDSGTITKSDIANYIFQNLNKFFSETDVQNLRAVHFNEKKVLNSFLRTDTDLPEELKKAIRIHYGIEHKEKKRTSKKADSPTSTI